MAIDIEGHVYVADAGNHRVLMLDLKLKPLQILLTQDDDDIINPNRLCYFVDNNLLFVSSNKKLSVYRLYQLSVQGDQPVQQPKIITKKAEYSKKQQVEAMDTD